MLGDPVSAGRLARDAEARAAAFPAGTARDLAVATAKWLEGESAYRTDDIAAAAPLIAAALATVERAAPGSRLDADLLLSRARIAVEQGKPQAGLADLQRAYRLFTRLGDARSEAKALQSIGSIYQDAQDSNRVLYYYRLANEVYPSDPTLSLSASNNMADAYLKIGKLAEAENEYKRALVTARKLRSDLLVARILNNIAELQILGRDFPAARATIAAGLALARTPKAAAWLPTILGTAADLELAEGNPAAAVRDVEAAFGAADRATSDQSFRALHLTAYRTYRETHDYAASLTHLEAFRKLDEAGRTLATSTNSALMAARFDFANQNARIATLKTGQLVRDVALARLRERQSTLILGSLLALGIVAIGFLFVYLRALRRSRNEIVASNRELAKTNHELAEALLAKSQFLATTSHEIRTPLNGILGMTQVMLAERSVTGVLRDRIALVDSAGRSMRSLVDDILDFAKMDSGALTVDAAPVDVAAILPDLVALWRVEAVDKGIELNLDIDVDAPVVTDAVRLRQIVFNLLSNAIKFTSAGAVTVSAYAETEGAGEQLVIAVRDSGVGIPATAFETIFEPFRQLDTSTTRRFGGTGLGLAISRHLAEALGGTIAVTSVLGEGSTFRLRLPYTRAEPVPDGIADAPAADDPPRARRVLVVSPNPITRSILRSTLAVRFPACVACGIDEVLFRIEQAMPDVIVIDADGLTNDEAPAFALLDQLAALGGSPIATAVICPATGAEHAAALRSRGAKCVIVKPVSANDLADAVAETAGFDPANLLSAMT